MPQAPTRCGDQKQRRNGRKRLKYYQIRLENVIKKSQNDTNGFKLVCLLSKIDNFFLSYHSRMGGVQKSSEIVQKMSKYNPIARNIF